MERRLAEVEDDDAVLVAVRRPAALSGENPRLRGVLVDRERRDAQAMLRSKAPSYRFRGRKFAPE
jgi:hypothetical protein